MKANFHLKLPVQKPLTCLQELLWLALMEFFLTKTQLQIAGNYQILKKSQKLDPRYV